ncbi:MAG TPA: DUF3443 domain-containing protein [Terriglobales bacterium]
MRVFWGILLIAAICIAISCGSGSSRPSSSSNPTPAAPGANVIQITVNSGPANTYTNGAFASVTVCVPNTSTCQTIDNVLVDTGSEGLRLLNSAVTAALPKEMIGGNTVAECVQYADGSFNWGSVRIADVKLGGEQASAVPIQIAGDLAASTIPTNCSTNAQNGSTGTENDTLQSLGANGILGLGPFRQDCGPNCPSSSTGLPSGVYLPYYVCPASGACQPSAVTLAEQVQNPVWMFAHDNNGVIIELPAIATTGAPSATGSLVFGIGTQSNNALGSATVLSLDNAGNFTTVFNNQTYDQSFIDSGSNGLYFPNASNIATCSSNKSFYCPASTLSLSATNTGANGRSSTVQFSVANAQTLFSSGNGSNTAFNDLAGTNAPPSFDWGLSFFYGRNVFTSIEGQSTPAGVGPFFAY